MKNVILYESHFELIQNLNDKQAGLLIKAIGLFKNRTEPKITDPLVLGIFTAIKRDFEIQFNNYQNKVETNRKNGKYGGRPKNPNNPHGYLETQPNPQNLKDKDKDKDKDILDTSSISSKAEFEASNFLKSKGW
jgi:hypothetical protein